MGDAIELNSILAEHKLELPSLCSTSSLIHEEKRRDVFYIDSHKLMLQRGGFRWKQ